MKTLNGIKFIGLAFIVIFLTSCVKGDNIALPPDPGEAGKATLAGIDSNNNGVRDDVEIAIYYRYPKDKQMRQVCYQLAKYNQKVLQMGAKEIISDDDVYNIWHGDLDRAIACVLFHEKKLGIELNRSSIYRFINSIVINTKERAIADQRFNHASDGKAFSSYDWENPCDYVGN